VARSGAQVIELIYITVASFVVRSSPKSLAEMQLVLIGLSGLPVFYSFYKIASRYLERRAFTNETAIDELSVLGKPHKGKKIRGCAVIVGGRYAILLNFMAQLT
jgi:hypothetical protein